MLAIESLVGSLNSVIFEKKPIQFWQQIWIQILVILLQLYLRYSLKLCQYLKMILPTQSLLYDEVLHKIWVLIYNRLAVHIHTLTTVVILLFDTSLSSIIQNERDTFFSFPLNMGPWGQTCQEEQNSREGNITSSCYQDKINVYTNF